MTAMRVPAAVAAAMEQTLAAALREETVLLRAMTDTFRAQRDAIGRDDAEGVADATFAANRIVHTMGEARRRRRTLLARVTGVEDLDLFALEDVLGSLMSEALRAARDEVARCAKELSEEVALNRMILRVALAAGEEQMRTLCGVAAPAAGYGAAGPGAEARIAGTFVNRKA